MNTFMPYLEAFMHIDALEEIVPSRLDEPIPAEDIENNAYLYELEIVLDEEDDFFIG